MATERTEALGRSFIFVGTIEYISYIIMNAVTCYSHYRRGFGLDIRFIDHSYTRIGTTRNYSAMANLHNKKSPQHPLSLFQHAVSLLVVAW
jgi:hypothetical protein